MSCSFLHFCFSSPLVLWGAALQNTLRHIATDLPSAPLTSVWPIHAVSVGECWGVLCSWDWDTYIYSYTSSPALTACIYEEWEWKSSFIPYLNWLNGVYSLQPQRIWKEVCAPSNYTNGAHSLDIQGGGLPFPLFGHFRNAMSAFGS